MNPLRSPGLRVLVPAALLLAAAPPLPGQSSPDSPEASSALELFAPAPDGSAEEVHVLPPAEAAPATTEAAAPAEDSLEAEFERTEAPADPRAAEALTAENTTAFTDETGAVPSDDFFAYDLKMSRAMAHLIDAVDRKDRPGRADAMEDLRKSLLLFDGAFPEAQAATVGPFAGSGNQALEARAALLIPRVMAMKHLSRQSKITVDLNSIQARAPRFESRDLVGIPLVKRGDPTRRVVALTYDDGPEPPHTTRVLDVLKSHGVKATFFVVGRNVVRHPALMRRIQAEGHEIAHHSWDHPKMTRLTTAQIRTQVQRTDEALKKVLPDLPPSPYFRLPYQIGSRSKRVHTALKERFRYIIDWTVDSQDYRDISVGKILARTVKPSQKNGAIVLFHDRRPNTAAATEKLIPALRAEGFSFGTVSEVMGTDDTAERVSALRAGLEQYSRGNYHEAAKLLGNFTLAHPESVAAPAALFCAFKSSLAARRPKAYKLRDALVRRYPYTLYGMRLAGRLPSPTRFVPGGPRKVRAAPAPLPPLEDPAPPAPEEGPPPSSRAAAPTSSVPASPAGTTPGEALPVAAPLPRVAEAPPRPPPLPRPRFAPRVLRPVPRSAPTPLPAPYVDPAPLLDGAHLVDPDTGD